MSICIRMGSVGTPLAIFNPMAWKTNVHNFD